jgi:hypothetical protein
MKKYLIILILTLLLLTGCSASDPLTDTLYTTDIVNSGNLTTNELWVNGTQITGDVYGEYVDIENVYISGISENDTEAINFDFEPTKILISYSARCHHANFPYEVGFTSGHSVITITAEDTITVDTNYVTILDENGTMDSAMLHSTTDILMAIGGYDGATYAKCWSTGTWETDTHTLTITFDDVENTRDAFNYFELSAVAYR